MLADIVSVQDRVRYVLDKDLPARDNDKRCWIQCMVKFYGLKEVLNQPTRNATHCPESAMSAFLNWFMQDNIPSMESVRRCRQKLQEKFPELRGTTYKERHKEAEGVRKWARP